MNLREIADKVIMVKNGTVVDIRVNDSPKAADDLNW